MSLILVVWAIITVALLVAIKSRDEELGVYGVIAVCFWPMALIAYIIHIATHTLFFKQQHTPAL